MTGKGNKEAKILFFTGQKRNVSPLTPQAIEAIKAYARENMSICTDNILADPLLHGCARSERNVALSENMGIDMTIHSAKYHAARNMGMV
jgi:integrase